MNGKWEIGRREFLGYSAAAILTPRDLDFWNGLTEEIVVYSAQFYLECTDADYLPTSVPEEDLCYIDEDGDVNFDFVDSSYVYSACGKSLKVSTLFLGTPPPGLVSLCDLLPTAYLRKLNPLTFLSCPVCGAGRWLVHSASLADSSGTKMFRYEEIFPKPFRIRFTPLGEISVVGFPGRKKTDQ